MKKSVIALAVAGTFAVAGAAQAQTTLTPYLTLDTSFGTIGSDAARDVQGMDSNIASSVFGFRASRDLGDGLTAHAQAEGDVNTVTGDVNPAGVWRRAANVGISGDFGRVDLGTRINPFIALHGSTYAMGGNSVSTVVAVSGGFADFFPNESITYTSPNLGGVVVQAQYGFLTVDGDDESRIALTAVYSGGPLRVGAGANIISAGEVLTPEGNFNQRAERTTIMAGGTYTLGDLVLSANVVNNDIEGIDDDWTFFSAGAAFKVMPQLTVGGTVGADDEGSMLVNLQARYHLHPAAHLYATVGHVDNDAAGASFSTLWAAGQAAAAAPGDDSDTGFAVGMILSF